MSKVPCLLLFWHLMSPMFFLKSLKIALAFVRVNTFCFSKYNVSMALREHLTVLSRWWAKLQSSGPISAALWLQWLPVRIFPALEPFGSSLLLLEFVQAEKQPFLYLSCSSSAVSFQAAPYPEHTCWGFSSCTEAEFQAELPNTALLIWMFFFWVITLCSQATFAPVFEIIFLTKNLRECVTKIPTGISVSVTLCDGLTFCFFNLKYTLKDVGVYCQLLSQGWGSSLFVKSDFNSCMLKAGATLWDN